MSFVISKLTNIPNQTTYLDHLNSNELTHLDSMSRMMYRIFILISDMYNFKTNIRLSNIWGSLDSTGKWHGAIGAINRSEVDFSITALRWDESRYGAFEHTTHSYHVQYVDFILIYNPKCCYENCFVNRLQFIFRHPKSTDVGNVFALPFQNMVWYATIGLCLLSAIIVRVTYLLERKLSRYNRNRTGLNDPSFSNSMLLVFGFLFQQSKWH